MSEIDRFQLAHALANVMGTNLEAVEDALADFDLPTVATTETFSEARDQGDDEHLRWDPTGNAAGVIVHFGDGSKVRVIVETVS